MRLCLDTNAYSSFKQGNAPLLEVLQVAESILVPMTVYGELCAGFYLGSKSQANFLELERFLERPGITLTEINRDIADRYGQLVRQLQKNGNMIPTNDIWIAATAMETGSRLVSYDRHFAKVPGLILISP